MAIPMHNWLGQWTTSTDPDTYVKVLQAQYQVNNHLYQGLYSAPLTTTTTGAYTTTTGYPLTTTTTYPTGIAGGYGVGIAAPTTAIPTSYQPSGTLPMAPEVGDRMIMEWDGSNWQTKYESAKTKPPAVLKKYDTDFTLDEIEAARDLIKEISEKRTELEAA